MPARVLVVDDLPVNVKLLETRLSVEYYDVLTAYDGKSALEIASREQPDIILLDVMMPDMDGYEVCQRLKSDAATRHIPVVMVTALDATRDRVQGLEAGADDFLSKPVNDTALFARLRSLVRLKRASDEWRAREATAVELGITNSVCLTEDETLPGNILVAERGMFDAPGIADALGAAGHEVEFASTDEDLLALSAFGRCDLVLLSDVEGSVDALKLCSKLRTQPDSRHVPLLLVIDEADDTRLAKALELGINDYLIRPVDRDELTARSWAQIRRSRYESRLRDTYVASVNAAVTDVLTGLYNRRYLESHFERIARQMVQGGKRISCLMVDIDHFKHVNDTYGHDAGDEVLKEVAGNLKNNLRGFDTAIRFGGEEFVIVMPDCSEKAAAIAAERLRRAVADSPVSVNGQDDPIKITISIGVATEIAGQSSLENLLRRADDALFEAKETGRNRVVSASDDGSSGHAEETRAIA